MKEFRAKYSSSCHKMVSVKHSRKSALVDCRFYHQTVMNCGHVFSQQFLITHMRTEPKQGKLVSNRTDSSVSVDERLIKESRGGSQRSLPLPDLPRKIEGPLLAGYNLRGTGINYGFLAIQ